MFQLNAVFQMSLANALLNYLHSLLSSYFLQSFKVTHIAHNYKSGRRGREVEVVTLQLVE